MNRSLLKGYMLTIVSAVVFGCMPMGAKLIYAEGVNPITLVFLRSFLTVPLLALLAKKKNGTLTLSKSNIKGAVAISMMGCCITPLLLFTSYEFISSGTATVLHYVYPAVTALVGIVFLKEPVRKSSLCCIALCTVGIALFYDPSAPMDLRGAAAALLSGVTYATYILLLTRCQNDDLTGFKLTFYNTVITSAVLLTACLTTGQLMLPRTAGTWIWTVIFAHCITIGAMMLFQAGTYLVGGQRAAILSTFEPITSLIVGVLMFNEVIGWRTLIGSSLVLSATITIALADLRENKQ